MHNEKQAEILSLLSKIEEEQQVTILYACESGSRAWGFASPDSDYDVRFVYAHAPDWYLSFDVETRRDVIEISDGFLDLSGWDLRKTLSLFYKSNGALVEWLRSPIVYAENKEFVAQLRALESSTVSLKPLCYHYLNMARHNCKAYLIKHEVRLKKYFYVLRPLLAIDWITTHQTPPPIQFEELLHLAKPEVKVEAQKLLEHKRTTSELGEGNPIPILDRFIAERLAEDDQKFKDLESQHDTAEVKQNLNKLFQSTLATAFS